MDSLVHVCLVAQSVGISSGPLCYPGGTCLGLRYWFYRLLRFTLLSHWTVPHLFVILFCLLLLSSGLAFRQVVVAWAVYWLQCIGKSLVGALGRLMAIFHI